MVIRNVNTAIKDYVMYTLKSKTVQLLSVIIIVLFLPVIANGRGIGIQNYENDPDLTKAMFYDLEYTKDKTNADRANAEKYYLAYLEKDLPNFQKAKVYCQLGVMYATAFTPTRGEKPDYKKAVKYFEKVLELEPERIGRETIRARTMLYSSPVFSSEERIAKGLKVYEWLISLDEDKIRELVLPSAPGESAISDLKLKSLSNYIPNVESGTAINVIGYTRSLPDRLLALMAINKRFPDTEIAEYAVKAIDKLSSKVADELIENIDGDFEDNKVQNTIVTATDQTGNTKPIKKSTNYEGSMSNKSNTSELGDKTLSNKTQDQKVQTEKKYIALYIVATVLILGVVVGFGLLRKGNKKGN